MLEASCEQMAPQPPLYTLLPPRGCVLLEGHHICLAKLQSLLIFYTPSADHELAAGGAGDMRLSSRTWLVTGWLFFGRRSLLLSLMTAELKNTQNYRKNKKPKQIKICFSLFGLWDFVSAQTIFTVLPAQEICWLAN